MRGILLDPFAETVTEVGLPEPHDFRDIYPIIGAQSFETLAFDAANVIFVDEQAALNNPSHFFELTRTPAQRAGKGLILGFNGAGESISTHLSIEDVRTRVKFKHRWFRAWNVSSTRSAKGFKAEAGSPREAARRVLAGMRAGKSRSKHITVQAGYSEPMAATGYRSFSFMMLQEKSWRIDATDEAVASLPEYAPPAPSGV